MRAIVLSCGMGAGIVAVRSLGGDVTLAWDDDQFARRICQKNFPYVKFGAPVALPPEEIPHSDVLVSNGWTPDAWSVLSVFIPRVIITQGNVATPPGYRSWTDDLEPAKFGAPLCGTRRMTVMLKDDIKTLFRHFPFPDGRPEVPLKSILEPGLPADGKYGSLVDVDKPCGKIRYHQHDHRSQLVPGEGGPRRLTTTECMRLYGFPSGYLVGPKMFPLLYNSMIPPMVAAIIEELQAWVDLP